MSSLASKPPSRTCDFLNGNRQVLAERRDRRFRIFEAYDMKFVPNFAERLTDPVSGLLLNGFLKVPELYNSGSMMAYKCPQHPSAPPYPSRES
jgi:hypothetical protein